MARKLIVEIVGDASSLNKSFREASNSANHFERNVSRSFRGIAAGSGLFKSLGRSIAFASGGFLAFAGLGDLLRRSIEAGTQAAATQRQLAAQFRASGLNLKDYNRRIEEATMAVSRLAGFENDELARAFTTAFRGTQNVTAGLRIQSIAADVARGTGKDLQVVTLGLTKAYLGQATAARRLGIIIPQNVRGMAALNFVQERFAGQARAGTTEQQRFAAVLHDTLETVGLALLPTFNKITNSLTVWLGKTENQRKLQKTTLVVLKDTGKVMGALAATVKALTPLVVGAAKAFGGLADAVRGVAGALEDANDVGNKLIHSVGGLFGFGGGGGVKPSSLRGQSTADRVAGRAPGGAGAFQAIVAAGAGAAGPRSPGLHERFRRSQLALAKAQVTATQADDRRVLAEQAKILRAAVSVTGNLKKRTQLYQQLASVEDQIRSIDKQAQDARDKARQDEIDRLEKQKQAAQTTLARLKQKQQTLRAQIENITQTFKAQLDSARSLIGDLFGGPILNFSDEQRKAALGIPNSAADPRALVRDLNAQVKQAMRFQRNIARLGRRGAPAELLKELQSGGLANATQVAALAGASKGTLAQFFKAFSARERLVQRIARAEMHAQLVTLHADRLRIADVKQQIVKVEVDIKGIDKRQVKVKQSAAQRRGNNPGRS